MDTIEIRLRLSYVEPLGAAERDDLMDRFRTVVERETSPGGELSLEESDLAEFELDHRRSTDR